MKHAWAGAFLTAAAGAIALLSGLIPEVAGLALLFVAKITAATSSLATAAHAHLTHTARTSRERLLWGTLTLAALLVLALALVKFWTTFSDGFRLVLLATPVLLVVIAIATRRQGAAA